MTKFFEGRIFSHARLTGTLLVAAGALAIGCGEDQSLPVNYSKSGKIVDLSYEPAHEETKNGNVCLLRSGNKPTGVCLLWNQVTETIPDEYEVTVEHCPIPPNVEDEECIRRSYDIDAEEFRDLQGSQRALVTETGDVIPMQG